MLLLFFLISCLFGVGGVGWGGEKQDFKRICVCVCVCVWGGSSLFSGHIIEEAEDEGRG